MTTTTDDMIHRTLARAEREAFEEGRPYTDEDAIALVTRLMEKAEGRLRRIELAEPLDVRALVGGEDEDQA